MFRNVRIVVRHAFHFEEVIKDISSLVMVMMVTFVVVVAVVMVVVVIVIEMVMMVVVVEVPASVCSWCRLGKQRRFLSSHVSDQ